MENTKLGLLITKTSSPPPTPAVGSWVTVFNIKDAESILKLETVDLICLDTYFEDGTNDFEALSMIANLYLDDVLPFTLKVKSLSKDKQHRARVAGRWLDVKKEYRETYGS